MKYKAQIIGVVLLTCVFGAIFAAWQLYFAAIFEGYRQDDRLRDTLENTFSQLQDTFQGYKPELLITEWQNKMQPWRMAQEDRAKYFNFGDWYDFEATPEETRMLKFWYTDVSNTMLQELYAKVFERMGGYDRFPADVHTMFNVAREEDWLGRDITREEVDANLHQLAFGISACAFLIDANASLIHNVAIWPRRIPPALGGLLGVQTVGLHFNMQARDLARMLDNLRQADRFFHIDVIKISYPHILYQWEPQLDVRMLLTQARYRPPADAREDAVALGQPGGVAMPGGMPSFAERPPSIERTPEVEPGIVGRAWQWFKYHVLVMH